jgi:apolipoprotein N-acyltransferase
VHRNSHPNPESAFGGKGHTCYLLCFLSGAFLGLSAPGIEQWFVAWIGLVPFLVIVTISARIWQSALMGLAFGVGYSLVAMHWLLGLAPLDWLGFNDWQGNLLALAALVIASLHQAILVVAFAVVFRLMPLHAGLLPVFQKRTLFFPALWTVPLIWVLCLNELGRCPFILGVPWSMLEYSQYRQLALIQSADIIGGIGIGYVIVLVNVFIALLSIKAFGLERAAALKIKGSFKPLAHVVAIALILFAMLGYGVCRLFQPVSGALSCSILQPNVNIEMQKTTHRYTLEELLAQELSMLQFVPVGICVMTESALPTRLQEDPALKALLSSICIKKKTDILIGAIDRDQAGNLYNAGVAITAQGVVIQEVYHKRYLVPFGEYTPIQGLPEWLLRLTNTPAGAGYTAGKGPVVFRISNGSLAPLICFETISPELAAQNVAAGGELLANISDLAWFHDSIIGEQMLACAVLRAVENRRYFIFAANTGPSAIISPTGVICKKSGKNVQDVITGNVALNSEISLFTRLSSPSRQGN